MALRIPYDKMIFDLNRVGFLRISTQNNEEPGNIVTKINMKFERYVEFMIEIGSCL
jgi:hypothetical protein